MNKKALELRIKQLESRLEDIDSQLEQANKNLDFLQRQRIATVSVLEDERWLLTQIFDQKFPVAPEHEREQLLAERTGSPDLTPDEVQRARDHVLKKEGMGFVEDIQQLKAAGELPRDP